MTVDATEEHVRNELSTELPFACDIVMKGGITSGVVYPTAIFELSKDHRLHNIGGASAGAIAAVVTAAAEYGRQTGGGGFDALKSIPSDLAETKSGQTLLQRIFVAQPATREYFNHFFEQRALRDASLAARARRLIPSIWRHSSTIPEQMMAKVGSFGLPAGGVAWLALAPSPGTIGFAVLAALTGAAIYFGSRIVSGVKEMISDAQEQIAGNMHGLVNGSSVGEQIGLTNWLHERVEEVAGPARSGGVSRPLTYGDLKAQKIGLVTLTTNLSQASSENFPPTDETWAFRLADFKKLFPGDVVTYLQSRGEAATEASSRKDQLEKTGLLKLPPAEELPVLLGARVSLSFPVVLSAVPLWRFVPVREPNGTWGMSYREVWLSDGGICSNMPVHLFDSPLPSRPTYGISLSSGASEGNPGHQASDEGMTYAHHNVWRPIRTGSGGGAPMNEITKTTELLSQVLHTMQNWSDNSMTRALGVRDRICTIRLAEGEGGMNLDMGSEKILGLAPRGRAAGENLGWMVRGKVPEHMDRPAIGQEDEAQTQWTRHRWTRLRSTMFGVERYLADVDEGWSDRVPVPQAGPHKNETSYPDLASAARTTPHLPYRSDWTDKAGRELTAAIDHLMKLDFGDVNRKSAPPFRRLTLSSRAEPEGDADE